MVNRELTSVDSAVVDLLAAARAARDQEITDRAARELMTEHLAEQQTNPKTILGHEAAALMQRIQWLHEHPRRLHFLGARAMQMTPKSYNYRLYAIETPSLITTEAEHAEDTAFALKDKYVFTYSLASRHLRISNMSINENTGAQEKNQEWFVRPRMSASSPLAVDVAGPEFDEWRTATQRQALEDYTKRNPWISCYRIYGDNQPSDYPFYLFKAEPKERWEMPAEPKKERKEPAELFWEHMKKQEELDKLNRELLPQLDPPNGCDFPDSFYTFPIGLIRQARRELGDKNV